METFDREKLNEFVAYVLTHDVQITLHRREAARRYNLAIALGVGSAAPFGFPAEKADKLATRLELPADESNHSVSVYAFIRIMGELRRALNATDNGSGSRPPSPTSSVSTQGE